MKTFISLIFFLPLLSLFIQSHQTKILHIEYPDEDYDLEEDIVSYTVHNELKREKNSNLKCVLFGWLHNYPERLKSTSFEIFSLPQVSFGLRKTWACRDIVVKTIEFWRQ